ncbi:ABC transporter ATP-binding protein [Chloroflexota bacterium]
MPGSMPVSVDDRILNIDDIYLSFGGINALTGISFDVRRGEILAIVGPNGAGKTCLINCISGFYRPQKGGIYYQDYQLTKLSPSKIAKLGIIRTFQHGELFLQMTTLDNIMAARHMFMRSGPFSSALYFGPSRKESIRHRRIVEDIIDFLGLQAVRKKVVGTLSYGWRKRVDMARALALEPKVLLLDEPMAGLSQEAKEYQVRYLLDIFQERGVPLVIIEHDMGVVMDISSRVVVLDFGEKIAEGAADEVMQHPEVVKAYWGKGR